jgi:hypothetical protein
MTERTEELETRLEHDREHLKQTVNELEHRLSPSQIIDQVFSNMGSGPKDFASNLLSDIQRQPLPSLLTATGLLWLAAGNGRDRTQTTMRSRPVDATDDELRAAHSWDRYQEATYSTTRSDNEDDTAYQRRLTENQATALGVQRYDDEDDTTYNSRVRRAADHCRDTSRGFRDRIGSAASGAYHGIGSAASATGHGIGSAASATGHGIASATSATGHGISSAASATGHGIKSSAESAGEFYAENPLASGALGLAIGTLLGSVLPLSRQEYDQFKGVADRGLKEAAHGVAGAAQATREASETVHAETRH